VSGTVGIPAIYGREEVKEVSYVVNTSTAGFARGRDPHGSLRVARAGQYYPIAKARGFEGDLP
jgi:hypothetical protein